MALRKSDGPFVIRLSRDGKPDRYYQDEAGPMEFPTMPAALLRVRGLRLLQGEYAAVVPVSAVPVAELARS